MLKEAAQQWRNQAKELRSKLAAFHFPETKAALTRLADRWDDMAKHAEICARNKSREQEAR